MPTEDDNSLFKDIDLTADNDDEDLSALDRGDTVDDDDSGEGNDADKSKGAKDDKDNGGAGDGGADGKDKAGKADAGKEGKDGGKGGKEKDEEDDGEDEGEGDDDGAGDGDGDDDGDGEDGDGDAAADKSTPARVKRAQRQRDNERARADALARELAAFKAGQRSAAPKDTGPTESETINADLEKLYEQVENLRADGETKEAARVQRDIDAKNRRLGQIENEVSASKREAAAAEDRAYNSHLDKLEELFPELQADHDDYDHAKVQRVVRAVNRNIAAGMLPSEAIVDAADLLFGVDLLAKPRAKAAPKEKAKDAGKADKDKAAADLAAARKKKVEAANKQPVDSSRRGADAAGDDTKIDPNRLSDDDFDKLPASVLAKMRGDQLA